MPAHACNVLLDAGSEVLVLCGSQLQTGRPNLDTPKAAFLIYDYQRPGLAAHEFQKQRPC